MRDRRQTLINIPTMQDSESEMEGKRLKVKPNTLFKLLKMF